MGSSPELGKTEARPARSRLWVRLFPAGEGGSPEIVPRVPDLCTPVYICTRTSLMPAPHSVSTHTPL